MGGLQRVTVGILAALVIGLFGVTSVLNWVEDHLAVPSEGSLLIDRPSGQVYRYEGGQKRHIVNATTLHCQRRPGQHLIYYRGLAELPDGPAIENREGCRQLPAPGVIVQPIGRPEVFVSTGSSLRPVPDARTLACLEDPRPVESVAHAYLENVPIGPPIPTGENCR